MFTTPPKSTAAHHKPDRLPGTSSDANGGEPGVLVLLHSGPGAISRLIRWQTRSAWNHASLWFPGEDIVIEARESKGVVETPVVDLIEAMEREPRLKIVAYEIASPILDADAVLRFAECQVGLGYDYLSVARFVSRRSSGGADLRWFCSELVHAAIKAGGVDLFRDTESWEVSPGLLSKSPLLRPYGESSPLDGLKAFGNREAEGRVG